jgi:serine/threonine protein kinase
MSTGSHYSTGKLPSRSMLQGRYLIVNLVGRGGMGAVYEAVDTSTRPNRRVAIKELSQSNLSTVAEVEKAKNRFRLEADMLRSLNHPNLPRVYASFEEGDRLYLVMDFIQGQTLLEMLQASYGRPLPIDQALNYACQ